MKTTTKTTTTNPPTLAAALSTAAYHFGEIMTYRPGPTVKTDRVRTGFGLGYGTGCPVSFVEVEIESYKGNGGEDPWGPAASCYIGGVCIGTRSAARNALAAAYAPVLAWIAAHEAAQATPAPTAKAA